MDRWVVRNVTHNQQVPTQTHVLPSTSTLQQRTSDDKTSKINNPAKATVESTKKVRKYQEEYLNYGFTFSVVNDIQRPLCVICTDMLANDSMKPVKLKRHFETKHSELKNKSIDYFKRKLKELGHQKTVIKEHTTVSKKAQRASYEASYLIARAKKPHTIGETLLLPAAVKMTEIMHGKKYADDLKHIPLSNDTVGKRIGDMSDDIRDQLLKRIIDSPKFAIQIDESTDIANQAQLLTYVRYCYETQMHEDLLFCETLSGRTTGEDIFKKINEFFDDNHLSWSNCIGVCTDGAAAMTGKNKGLVAKIKTLSEDVMFTHCIIHREALASKKMAPELHDVLKEAVLIVNFVKSRALQSRLFSILCKEMGADHDSLLLHAEVRWLSRGKVLRRLVELKEETRLFLLDANETLAAHFLNEKWLSILCYLADIFERLNDLNTSLQGRNTNSLILFDKINAFVKKLDIWERKTTTGCLDMFPFLSEFIDENDLSIVEIQKLIIHHLAALKTQFQHYFRSDWTIDDYDWVRRPFNSKVKTNHLSLAAQEELAELSSDRTLQAMFETKDMSDFWLSVSNEYPVLTTVAINVLLPFASTYLCETAFSALTYIKSKYRTRLDAEKNLRVALSTIVPDIDHLCSRSQGHCSH